MKIIEAAVALFLSTSSYNGPIPTTEIYCMARAVYYESRGEPLLGQHAVAYVVLNRMEKEHYPDNACEVIYQPAQFSGLTPHTPINENSPAWRSAVQVALLSYTRFVEDPTAGATLFYNPRKVKKPKWRAIPTVKISNHIFLRENHA